MVAEHRSLAGLLGMGLVVKDERRPRESRDHQAIPRREDLVVSKPKRWVIMAEGDLIDLPDVLRHAGEETSGLPDTQSLYAPGLSFKSLHDAAGRRILEEALAHDAYNMSETARALEMERSHLYKKCRALGVETSKSA